MTFEWWYPLCFLLGVGLALAYTRFIEPRLKEPFFCTAGWHDFQPTWRAKIGYNGQDWEWLERRDCSRGCGTWVSLCQCCGHDGEEIIPDSPWTVEATGEPLYDFWGGIR